MRTILIIFATFVVIAGGFFAYLWFQPAPGGQGGSVANAPGIVPASRPSELPDPDRIGGGGPAENVWLKSIDAQTGELASEFRASHTTPHKDGSVDVVDPEAKFYLGTREPRQMVMIRGQRGKVFIPDPANKKRDPLRGGQSSMPSRGKLEDVILFLFDTAESSEPTLTCTMNNASFDQETFRIVTEAYESNGRVVAADQVEVQVRGRDYDFNGRGLDLRWNERDRRLQLLEIAHGESLVVKHPQAVHGMSGPSTQPSARRFEENNSPLASGIISLDSAQSALPLLVAADDAAVGNAIKAPAPAAPRRRPPPPKVAPVNIVRNKAPELFRATFLENVRIVQTDQQLASANVMHVDFVMESAGGSTTKPATNPSPAAVVRTPEAASPAAGIAGARPSRAPAVREANPTQPKEDATAKPPSTQPEDQPITIFWTGKLRVTPVDAESPNPPAKDDAIVTLLGDPVVMTHNGSQTTAAAVHYWSKDSSLIMENSPTVKEIVMRDVNGTIIRTPSLDYDGEEGIAILRSSRADIVLTPPSATQSSTPATRPSQPPQILTAIWSRTCRLFLAGSSQRDMTIDRAEIDGDVTIDHPELKGKSQSLELAFRQVPTTKPVKPGATTNPTEPELQNVVAIGDVHYVMTPASKPESIAALDALARPEAIAKSNTIDCGKLTLTTAKDEHQKVYARSLEAEGSVHAFDDEQDLKSGQLKIWFLPSTQPSTQAPAEGIASSSIQVDSLSASQDVRVTSATGDSATADHLEMQTKDGKREIRLIGQPMAHVKQKENVLNGPIIVFDPDGNKASVVGAGTMHAIQQPGPDSKDKKPQPVDVSWAGNMTADGNLNLIDISDDVVLNSITADGAVNEAKGQRLKLTLMDDPKAATQPTTRKSDKPSAMDSAGFGQTSFFKDKLIKTVTLQDNMQVSSVSNDDAGNLLRRMFMKAPLMQYAMQDKILLVPAAGEMLVQDTSKPAASADSQSTSPLGDVHGATAFQWGRELRYDETQRRMTMSGKVHIRHETGDNSQPFTLDAQTVTADLEPIPPADPAVKAPATTQPGNEKMRLKHMTATDQVEFISGEGPRQIHFLASSVDYDPNTHKLIAKGTERSRAELFDRDGNVQSSFLELRYDTQTGMIENTTQLRAVIRK